MKVFILIATLFIGQAIASSGHYGAGNKVKDAKFYGSPFTTKKVLPIKTVINDIKNYKDKTVLVEAKVGKVCKKKGCWMTLVSEDVRVKFKDYSFFVPMSLVGKKVHVEGVIKAKNLTKKEALHYAEDAGIKNPKKLKLKEFRMIASGVRPL